MSNNFNNFLKQMFWFMLLLIARLAANIHYSSDSDDDLNNRNFENIRLNKYKLR